MRNFKTPDSSSNEPDTQLSEEDIDDLAKFFDLLWQFDQQDKVENAKREGKEGKGERSK